MLICLTASHKTADFVTLERLSVGTESIGSDIRAHSECVSGAVVVATCNRFEAYVDVDEPVTAGRAIAVEATIEAVTAATGVEPEQLREVFEVHVAERAAEHLFAVSAGLESVVVGEGEIAGQVRRSLTSARQAGTTSSDLERLFQRASQTSRTIKNQTALSTAGRSLVRLALDLAESRVTDWAQTRVLLFGTGAYAGASLAALRDRGVEDVEVYSASGRAERFAASHGIDPVSDAGLPRAIARAEIIITCTTSEDYVLDADRLRAAHESAAVASELPRIGAAECPVRHDVRQLVVDLGLPRNVNPDVQHAPGVELLDLETIRLHAPLEELQASSSARTLVSKAARKFSTVSQEQNLTPAIVALRSHVFGILDAELERVAGKSPDPRTEQALRHLAGVLLHTPTSRAREFARAGQSQRYIDAIETLFGVVPEASPVDAVADAADSDEPAVGA
ncbi:glutamyl-tRNA reductase [Mycetocola reblochoni]|uniref:Glutamyl-tRNA reductase n=2 Tax=Mycetocola reblochoni TaxID=331618 RepID=A0A1R4ISA7_9MICO|nr:glutamyl-tRNA reductase [Mycetocola reblochoni]RLP71141.1 glutamyl-tRNA reductase [Mycetocola reblochoni]SJN22574.1 Glutamyl-tRNA reductase [Mycetocola reblochoni REB411]